ncbi:MAG: hypothetical protein R6U32_07610 [Candidatus Woesearchaeota archaeon]
MFSKPQRRAQAAMEFLMTYGWAVLAVLIIIAALNYFGVLNPQRLLPDKCVFTSGVECRDMVAYSDGYLFGGEFLNLTDSEGNKADIKSLSFDLVNGLGETVYVRNISISGEGGFDCMNLQIEDCAEGSAIGVESEKDPDTGDYVPAPYFNAFKDCISLKQFCESEVPTPDGDYLTKLCGPGSVYWPYPVKSIMRWEAGKSFKQVFIPYLEDYIPQSEYISLPCRDMPSEGEKIQADIRVEYYFKDPDFTHIAEGDLYLTVESRE